MSIYRPENSRVIQSITPSDRLSNQVVIVGTNEKLLSKKGVFFLELLILPTSGTVIIKDGKGKIIASGLTGFEQDFVPLRCDYGIEFVGDVELAKGFMIENVFL